MPGYTTRSHLVHSVCNLYTAIILESGCAEIAWFVSESIFGSKQWLDTRHRCQHEYLLSSPWHPMAPVLVSQSITWRMVRGSSSGLGKDPFTLFTAILLVLAHGPISHASTHMHACGSCMGDCHSWHYMVMLSKPSARKKSGPVETGLTRLEAMALHSLKAHNSFTKPAFRWPLWL